MNIPYSAEPRPSTGLTNARLGMMLFGALMTSYVFLRASSSDWAAIDGLPDSRLAFLNTALMAGSSLAIAAASRRGARSAPAGPMLALVLAFGAGFILSTLAGCWTALDRGIHPATSTYAAIWFVLTSLHALHVAGGLAAVGLLLGPWRASGPAGRERFGNRVGVTAIYWHFLTAAWVVTIAALLLA